MLNGGGLILSEICRVCSFNFSFLLPHHFSFSSLFLFPAPPPSSSFLLIITSPPSYSRSPSLFLILSPFFLLQGAVTLLSFSLLQGTITRGISPPYLFHISPTSPTYTLHHQPNAINCRQSNAFQPRKKAFAMSKTPLHGPILCKKDMIFH